MACNAGKQSTHALLFAQLWTRGMCQGLHGFFIPVRDPVTMQPYPGLTIGDIGEKAGVHGIDNGHVQHFVVSNVRPQLSIMYSYSAWHISEQTNISLPPTQNALKLFFF